MGDQIEVERKFLVEASPGVPEAVGVEILQGYLALDGIPD